eukprot:COSAG03_NODE_2449_length_2748_cov_14.372971_5_plen_89_part_00
MHGGPYVEIYARASSARAPVRALARALAPFLRASAITNFFKFTEQLFMQSRGTIQEITQSLTTLSPHQVNDSLTDRSVTSWALKCPEM